MWKKRWKQVGTETGPSRREDMLLCSRTLRLIPKKEKKLVILYQNRMRYDPIIREQFGTLSNISYYILLITKYSELIRHHDAVTTRYTVCPRFAGYIASSLTAKRIFGCVAWDRLRSFDRSMISVRFDVTDWLTVRTPARPLAPPSPCCLGSLNLSCLPWPLLKKWPLDETVNERTSEQSGEPNRAEPNRTRHRRHRWL